MTFTALRTDDITTHITSQVECDVMEGGRDIDLVAKLQFVSENGAATIVLSNYLYVHSDHQEAHVEEAKAAILAEVEAFRRLKEAVEQFGQQYLARAEKVMETLENLPS